MTTATEDRQILDALATSGFGQELRDKADGANVAERETRVDAIKALKTQHEKEMPLLHKATDAADARFRKAREDLETAQELLRDARWAATGRDGEFERAITENEEALAQSASPKLHTFTEQLQNLEWAREDHSPSYAHAVHMGTGDKAERKRRKLNDERHTRGTVAIREAHVALRSLRCEALTADELDERLGDIKTTLSKESVAVVSLSGRAPAKPGPVSRLTALAGHLKGKR